MSKLITDEGVKVGVAGAKDTSEVYRWISEVSNVIERIDTNITGENPGVVIIPVTGKEGNYDIVPRGCEITGYELAEELYCKTEPRGESREERMICIDFRPGISDPTCVNVFHSEQRERHPRVYEKRGK